MKIKLPVRRKAPAPKRPPRLKLKASVASRRRAPVIEDDEDFYEEPEPNMKLSHAFVVVLVLHVIAVAGVFAFNTIKARQDQVFAATTAATQDSAETATAAADAPAPGTINASAAAPKPLTTTPGLPAQPIPVSHSAPAVAEKAPAAAPKGAVTHEVKAGETLTRISAQYGVSIADLEAANGIDDPTKIRVGTVLTIPQSSNTPKPAVTEAAVRPQIEKPAEKPAPAAAAADSGEVYEVVKGDNPVSIAKRFGVSYDALMKLNNISDPRLLQIGQKLKIPAKD